jgi:hypothetical protein
MLRPRGSAALPVRVSFPRYVRPLHVSPIQFLKAKTYKGEPPRKPKPKAKPSGSIGASQPQKHAVPEKKEAVRPVAKKAARDPLLGMREANELSKMVKYPATTAQQAARNPSVGQLRTENGQQAAQNDSTTDSDSTHTTASRTATSQASSSLNRRPIPPADPLPFSMASKAPSGAPFVHPLQSTADKAKWILAAMALAFFVAGAYLAFGPGANDDLKAHENIPAMTSAPLTPKDKPLPANMKRAMELLKAYFKARASSLDEDTEEFGGAGINVVGGGIAVPRMVVYPETREEVEIILNICQKYGVAVIPYSGGTSLEGYTHLRLFPSQHFYFPFKYLILSSGAGGF